MTSSPSRTDRPIDSLDKGAPALSAPVELDVVAAKDWNLLREDLPLPVAIARDDALRNNSAWMRDFLSRTGARIAPHGKTSMAPALFEMQLEDGAWGITLSTPHQIRVARAHGINRIFLANQLIGREAVRYVLHELAGDSAFDFYCLVESIDHVAQLDALCTEFGPTATLKVLVEIGFEGGRTGCRTDDGAMQVARAVSGAKHLHLCGVEGFEGIIRGDTQSERIERVCTFLDRIARVAERCAEENLFETSLVLLTAGGTSFFDLVVDRLSRARMDLATMILTRSGCYLTFDAQMFKTALERMKTRSPQALEGLGELRPALEVWAYVQSRPEPDLLLASLGKRDISYDDLPIPIYCYRNGRDDAPRAIEGKAKTFRLDDQHCYVRIDAASDFEVGDLIGFGISHPCLTFDKWRLIYRVNETYDIVGAFRTYF